MENKAFMGLFWSLSSPDVEKRVHASASLIAAVQAAQQRVKGLGTHSPELDSALKKLVRGLSNSRVATRDGSAVALTQLLMSVSALTTADVLTAARDDAISTPEGIALAALCAARGARDVIRDDSAAKRVIAELVDVASTSPALRELAAEGMIELIQRVAAASKASTNSSATPRSGKATSPCAKLASTLAPALSAASLMPEVLAAALALEQSFPNAFFIDKSTTGGSWAAGACILAPENANRIKPALLASVRNSPKEIGVFSSRKPLPHDAQLPTLHTLWHRVVERIHAAAEAGDDKATPCFESLCQFVSENLLKPDANCAAQWTAFTVLELAANRVVSSPAHIRAILSPGLLRALSRRSPSVPVRDATSRFIVALLAAARAHHEIAYPAIDILLHSSRSSAGEENDMEVKEGKSAKKTIGKAVVPLALSKGRCALLASRLASCVDVDGARALLAYAYAHFANPSELVPSYDSETETEEEYEKRQNAARAWCCEIIASITASYHLYPAIADDALVAAKFLFFHSFCFSVSGKVSAKQVQQEPWAAPVVKEFPLSQEQKHSCFVQLCSFLGRVVAMSDLGGKISSADDNKERAAMCRGSICTSSEKKGNVKFWCGELLTFAQQLLQKQNKNSALDQVINDEGRALLKNVTDLYSSIAASINKCKDVKTATQMKSLLNLVLTAALVLLFVEGKAHSTESDEDEMETEEENGVSSKNYKDDCELVDDMIHFCTDLCGWLQDNKKLSKDNRDKAMDVLVDAILSLLVRESRLIRRCCEVCFVDMSAYVTESGINALADALLDEDVLKDADEDDSDDDDDMEDDDEGEDEENADKKKKNPKKQAEKKNKKKSKKNEKKNQEESESEEEEEDEDEDDDEDENEDEDDDTEDEEEQRAADELAREFVGFSEDEDESDEEGGENKSKRLHLDDGDDDDDDDDAKDAERRLDELRKAIRSSKIKGSKENNEDDDDDIDFDDDDDDEDMDKHEAELAQLDNALASVFRERNEKKLAQIQKKSFRVKVAYLLYQLILHNPRNSVVLRLVGPLYSVFCQTSAAAHGDKQLSNRIQKVLTAIFRTKPELSSNDEIHTLEHVIYQLLEGTRSKTSSVLRVSCTGVLFILKSLCDAVPCESHDHESDDEGHSAEERKSLEAERKKYETRHPDFAAIMTHAKTAEMKAAIGVQGRLDEGCMWQLHKDLYRTLKGHGGAVAVFYTRLSDKLPLLYWRLVPHILLQTASSTRFFKQAQGLEFLQRLLQHCIGTINHPPLLGASQSITPEQYVADMKDKMRKCLTVAAPLLGEACAATASRQAEKRGNSGRYVSVYQAFSRTCKMFWKLWSATDGKDDEMIGLLQAEKLKQIVSDIEKKGREGNGKNIDRATRSLHSTVHVFMHETPQRLQQQRLQQQQQNGEKIMSNKKRKQMARLEAWLARVKANEANGEGGQKRPRPSSKQSETAAAIAAEEAKHAEAKKLKKKQASVAKRRRMQALQQ